MLKGNCEFIGKKRLSIYREEYDFIASCSTGGGIFLSNYMRGVINTERRAKNSRDGILSP